MTPGYFGKIPSRADFVSQRIPRVFRETWDSWLQESILTSRGQLGASWLDYYLTSPIWRFVLSSGICGEDGWAGVVMPSVDSVERYFPLTLGGAFSAAENPFEVLRQRETWFVRMESLARACLEEDYALEALDEGLESLGQPDSTAPASATPSRRVAEGARAAYAWHVDAASPQYLASGYPELVRGLTETIFSRFSLWWSSGSQRIRPTLLICRNLPRTESYSAMLEGSWSRWGWFESGVSLGAGQEGEIQVRPGPDPAI